MEFIKEAYRIHAHDGKGKILAEIEFPEVSPGVLTELKFFCHREELCQTRFI